MISATVSRRRVGVPSLDVPRFLAVRGYTWRRVFVEVTIFAALALSGSVLGPASH